MTPEETLDWLAQQHFDQCREERPIQDWIRKMKSQLPVQPAVAETHKQEPTNDWSDWRDMVVVNIMRHGSIDKHLARELANHFQSMTPQPKEPEQEPLEYWNAVEGWVKIDEVREHFDSVGCGTIYKTAGEGRVPLSLCKAQPDNTAKLYEELRSIIDGGSESFTHEDAVQYLKNKLAQPTQDWIKRERAFGYREGHQNALKQMAQPEQRSNEHLEPVAWYIREKDMLTRDANWVSEYPDMCEPLYTTPQPVTESHKRIAERKPLTHEQRLDLHTAFEPHKSNWNAQSILIDMVEAAHGIKE